MPLTKSTGNMYPWVTHTHTHIGGECPHLCDYCYVQAMAKRFKNPRYTGPLFLILDELQVNYGTGKTIFIEHCTDLFCEDMPDDFIRAVIQHCMNYPLNVYVFQTKNPRRYFDYEMILPKGSIIGTTIETNRADLLAKHTLAPAPELRFEAMRCIDWPRKFVTIEPVMDFDPEILAEWIIEIKPEFLNLGADSKGGNLEELTIEKVMELVRLLHEGGIELREKSNLERLRK